jgi:hypothetical protein
MTALQVTSVGEDQSTDQGGAFVEELMIQYVLDSEYEMIEMHHLTL